MDRTGFMMTLWRGPIPIWGKLGCLLGDIQHHKQNAESRQWRRDTSCNCQPETILAIVLLLLVMSRFIVQYLQKPRRNENCIYN